jgi:hypothetical protein
MNGTLFSLFLTFFAGSWLSNLGIIRTTTSLLQGSSLELILAVSSCAGLAFFVLLRFLDRFQKPTLAAWLMLPVWLAAESLSAFAPQAPVWSALGALLFGELAKWHAYSQVLHRFGPLSAGRILGWAVLAYELGTVTAAFTASLPENHWLLRGLELLALASLYLPFALRIGEEATPQVSAVGPTLAPPQLLSSLLVVGAIAGFLKISADTGFKFALSSSQQDVGPLVVNFYLLSAGFTMALGLIRRFRWFAPRMGCPQASLTGLAVTQGIFALALFSGNLTALVAATALQRSVDKIFYQPTIQLLTSGFAPALQDLLRRWHVTAFLAIGSLLGLGAFFAHGLFTQPSAILAGMSGLHLVGTLICAMVTGHLVSRIVQALDRETRLAGVLGGSRAMAMLALLSPRHFLVHALVWSSRRGGMQGLPTEILQGLSADAGGEVVESFYSAYPEMDEGHQLALIRLAVFLDRKMDHAFLLGIASEAIPSGLRARRLAAIHVVKVHGKMYRPLLRRARGKNSPLPMKKAA